MAAELGVPPVAAFEGEAVVFDVVGAELPPRKTTARMPISTISAMTATDTMMRDFDELMLKYDL